MESFCAPTCFPHPHAQTINGRTVAENCGHIGSENHDVIRSADSPILQNAGFLNLKGNLFDSAIMKTSVISEEFRQRYLENPEDPMAFEGRAIVFDGPEHFHATIDDESLGVDETSILVMRGAGPIGYPGGAEVVNMRPPAHLLKQGVHALPCIGDGRQSGTSGSPSILNASPEAAADGGLALVRTGDRLRVDLGKGTANLLVDDDELERRRGECDMPAAPETQSPWQEIFRSLVLPFSEGMTLRGADAYTDIANRHTPRDNH